MNDDLHERLAPLRRRRFEDPAHKERLRESLRTARGPRRALRRRALGLALFGGGAMAALAAQEGLRRWSVRYEEAGEPPQEFVLEALGPAAGPPQGPLRAEDGSLYVVEERDGRLVMRPLEEPGGEGPR